MYPVVYYNQNYEYIKWNSDYWKTILVAVRVSKNLHTTACFVQWNGGWALEEFKRSCWVNEPWMLNSACTNYSHRSLPINQPVATWTAQHMSISNTIRPPQLDFCLHSTAQWLPSTYKYEYIHVVCAFVHECILLIPRNMFIFRRVRLW
jgi:hypothetical protein